MTRLDAWTLACKAALLPDKDAADFLRQHLDAATKADDGADELVHALAWLAPEEALKYAADPRYVQTGFFEPGKLEAHKEAAQLLAESEDQQAAYAAVTALLPQDSSAAITRLCVQRLACARLSPTEFLRLPNWEDSLDFFLFARLWLACPEQLLKRISSDNVYRWRQLYSPIGQILLTEPGPPYDFPKLIELIDDCSLHGYAYFVSPVLRNTLAIIEKHTPQDMALLLPGLGVLTGREDGADEETAATTLILLNRYQPGGTALLLPWKVRIEQSTDLTSTHRWLRDIRRILLQRVADSAPPRELLRVFRMLLLAQRIHRRLFRNKRLSVSRARRGWRWLQRSERVIASVADPFWQDQLREKKASLETRVRQSHRPAHRALFEGEAR